MDNHLPGILQVAGKSEDKAIGLKDQGPSDPAILNMTRRHQDRGTTEAKTGPLRPILPRSWPKVGEKTGPFVQIQNCCCRVPVGRGIPGQLFQADRGAEHIALVQPCIDSQDFAGHSRILSSPMAFHPHRSTLAKSHSTPTGKDDQRSDGWNGEQCRDAEIHFYLNTHPP